MTWATWGMNLAWHEAAWIFAWQHDFFKKAGMRWHEISEKWHEMAWIWHDNMIFWKKWHEAAWFFLKMAWNGMNFEKSGMKWHEFPKNGMRWHEFFEKVAWAGMNVTKIGMSWHEFPQDNMRKNEKSGMRHECILGTPLRYTTVFINLKILIFSYFWTNYLRMINFKAMSKITHPRIWKNTIKNDTAVLKYLKIVPKYN